MATAPVKEAVARGQRFVSSPCQFMEGFVQEERPCFFTHFKKWEGTHTGYFQTTWDNG